MSVKTGLEVPSSQPGRVEIPPVARPLPRMIHDSAAAPPHLRTMTALNSLGDPHRTLQVRLRSPQSFALSSHGFATVRFTSRESSRLTWPPGRHLADTTASISRGRDREARSLSRPPHSGRACPSTAVLSCGRGRRSYRTSIPVARAHSPERIEWKWRLRRSCQPRREPEALRRGALSVLPFL